MKELLIFRVFLKDLNRQRKRITLTILAIAWGTISIVMLLAFGEGMKRALNKAQHGMGQDIVVMWGGQTSIAYQGLGKGRRIRFTEEDVELLKKKTPELEKVGGEYSRWGISMTYQKNTVSEHLTGVYPTYLEIRAHYPILGGRFINQQDMVYRRRVVFLGDELKSKLFGQEEAVGKTVLISNVPFTVIGSMTKKMQMGMYGGPDANKASIPATTFAAIFGHKYLNVIVYKPKDPNQIESVKAKVLEVLAGRYKFDPKDTEALWVWDVIEGQKTFNKVLIGFQIFLGIIGGMTLLIAGVGVANIMYVVVKERTKEIGIKMALGAKRIHIMSQFLTEALLITILGGALGVSVSLAITKLWALFPQEADWMKWLGKPTISVEIALITVLILGSIGLLSGLFPSRQAATVDPAQSMRYE